MKVPLEGGTTVTLVSGAGGSSSTDGIALDAMHVYYAVDDHTGFDGSIAKMSLDGSGWTLLASGQANPQGVAVDAARAYWGNSQRPTDGGIVMSVPTEGGSLTTEATATSPALDVALDANNLYWTIVGESLMKRPIAGGSATVLGSNCTNIAVDATGVYCAGTAITRVPLDGGAPVTLATGYMFAVNIAVDETAVYWTDPYNATLTKVAK